MSGTPYPHDLGSTLPPGITASAIARLVVPTDGAGPVGMVGLKPWAVRPGWFIALACTGGNGPSEARLDGCPGGGSSTPLHAYVALVEKDEAGRLKLAARLMAVERGMKWIDVSQKCRQVATNVRRSINCLTRPLLAKAESSTL